MKGRLFTSVVTTVLVTVFASATPASAHHGFTGRYDRSSPLYIEGQITQATYNLPHGLITIQPSQPVGPPPDLLELGSAAYVRLGGRDVVTRSRPIEAVGGGVLVLLLTPPMTSEVAGRAAPPARGQPIGAIAFRECSTGELRVQLLRVSATDALVRIGVLQTEVDGCGSRPNNTCARSRDAIAGRRGQPATRARRGGDRGAHGYGWGAAPSRRRRSRGIGCAHAWATTRSPQDALRRRAFSE